MRIVKRSTWIFAVALAMAGASGRTGRLEQPTVDRYYAHTAVRDADGILAPWYSGQNGQVDWRVRIAAETMKRYPWTENPAKAPHYVYNGTWRIAQDGTITVPQLNDWDNGDLGQRAAYILTALVDYYRYTGDPAAIAQISLTADGILDHCLTGKSHPWPGVLISVPIKGVPYGKADPKGLIQLDIVAEVGIGLVRAYQMVGNERWWTTAKRWADLFARHARKDPHLSPWPRYANPEDALWEDLQTGGVVFILEFLDEVMRLGYTGVKGDLAAVRDMGRRYLRDVLLPRWTVDDTWGRNYWDWNDPVQAENVLEFVARYLMAHPKVYPNWRQDVRNILTLFLNRTSVDPASSGGVFSGAWAYPESSACCGRSLWYGPMELAPVYAELGNRTGDRWALEIARRMMILATYDAHETGVVEDNIDGGAIVADGWFKIAHPMALKHCLNAIGQQPELFGAARESHLVATSHVVSDVTYAPGRIEYRTHPAAGPTTDVLRMSFRPARITVDGKPWTIGRIAGGHGATVKGLPSGDCIVTVRRDGTRSVVIEGPDPDTAVFRYEAGGPLRFNGNHVRIVGEVGPDGGLAEVVVDGEVQRTLVDCWAPMRRRGQTLYYRNGLANGEHRLELRPLGKGNPVSNGALVKVSEIHTSAAIPRAAAAPSPSCLTAPAPQRVIFGYTGRRDYRASDGTLWRPATEWIARLGFQADIVAAAWRTQPLQATISGTKDPELYRYGAHAPDLTAFFTVAPGDYTVRLHFAEYRRVPPDQRALNITINGEVVAERVDLAASAGGVNRALVLAYPGVRARSGTVAVRLKGHLGAEAIVHAIEILPGRVGARARPISLPESSGGVGNLLRNGGFEETVAGYTGSLGSRANAYGWTYLFASPIRSYIWAETDYIRHPEIGLPEIRTGKQALRTHTNGYGHTMIYQDVRVDPGRDYQAEVWVRAADIHGRGFGKNAGDRAGLVLQELSEDGSMVREHRGPSLTDAGDYRRLEMRFRTADGTHRVRFILEAVQQADYKESHVTFDDAALRLIGP